MGLASELARTPALFAAYREAFGEHDDVSLLVDARGWTVERIEQELVPAAARGRARRRRRGRADRRGREAVEARAARRGAHGGRRNRGGPRCRGRLPRGTTCARSSSRALPEHGSQGAGTHLDGCLVRRPEPRTPRACCPRPRPLARSRCASRRKTAICQARRARVRGQLPRAAHEAVDEQRPLREDGLAMRGIDDAPAVAVRDERVVVLGQEAGWSRRLRRPAAVHPGGRRARGRARRERSRARGAVRSKISPRRVSPHQVCASSGVAGPNAARYRRTRSSRVSAGASASPVEGAERGQPDDAALAPDAARGQLHERQQVPQALRHRLAVPIGKPLDEEPRELRVRARLLLEQLAPRRHERVEIHADERAAPGAAREEPAVEHRREPGSECVRVTGRDEVDGRAHQDDAHRRARAQPLGEIVLREALEARPETVVGRVRRLCLQAHEVLERVRHRHRPALEQPLTGEQRAVQRARREHRPSHAEHRDASVVRAARGAGCASTPGAPPPMCASNDHRHVRDPDPRPSRVRGAGRRERAAPGVPGRPARRRRAR